MKYFHVWDVRPRREGFLPHFVSLLRGPEKKAYRVFIEPRIGHPGEKGLSGVH
ncbi:MAG: hypothetical protein JRJ70_13385 [Deltaproteobacteria bacterium]|nr:hypothetical protein [Deltaproteobacteria bacterium]